VTGVGRRAGSLIALVGLGGLGPPACQTNSQPSTCDFQLQAAEAASPLTLLPTARLDRVGNGFLLLGRDGGLVRWAPVDERGTVGAQNSAQLPATMTAGPWFAAAGRTTPGDTVLIAYGVASSTAGMVDVQVVAAPAAGGNPVTAGTLVTLPDPSSTSASGALVAMGSSRLGMRAGFAWAVPGQPQVNIQSLGADGRAQGAALVQPSSTTAPQIPCLSFVNGKDDLAVGFLAQVSTADPNPSWTVVEVRDDGGLENFLTLRLGTENPSCPLSAATTGGYVTTWQNQLGSWIGVYDSASNLLTSHLFAGAVTFGGADAQPPLAGVGAVAGGDFAVVLAAPGAAAAWRVDPMGQVGTDTVTFPSSVGQMGQISTVSFSGAVYATYADYTSSSTVGADGQRYFVKVTCF
jgi:phage tail protein X